MKNSTKNFVRWITFSALGAVTISQSFAGNALYLKSGTFQLPETRSSRFASLFQSEQSLNGRVLAVVQFRSAVSERVSELVRTMGLEVLGYFPDDALIVRGSLQSLDLARGATHEIRAIVPFQADWKVSEELFKGNFSKGVKPELILGRTFSEEDALRFQSEVQSIPGAKLLSVSGKSVVIQLEPRALQAVAESDAIEWLQEMPVMQSFDFQVSPDLISPPVRGAGNYQDLTGLESGTEIMGLKKAWSRGLTGKGQIVAVADTGLDTGDLATLNPDFKNAFIKGYPMGIGVRTWADGHGHGSHVMGSVLGSGAKSNGSIRGGAFDAKLVAVGMWSAIADNLAVPSDFNKLVGIPMSDGARIHSNSWGSGQNLGAYEGMSAGIDEFMFNNPEMLVIFAAGNSGEDNNKDGKIDRGSVCSPGTAKNVLTVGASENLVAGGGIQKTWGEWKKAVWGVEPVASDTPSNNPMGIAAFSSRGPTQDGRLKPEVVAPGTNILSTKSMNTKSNQKYINLWGAYNNDYVWAGGTSMSTPLTAGAAAIARQFMIEKRGMATPSSALVKALLMHTALDLAPGQYGPGPKAELSHRPDVHQGYGRVDVDALTSTYANAQLIDNRVGVATGEESVFNLTIGASGSLVVTMVYTDAAGAPGAGKALVNDLDLEVYGTDGKTRLAGTSDRINNNEMVELTGLKAGQYKLVVKGINVPKGRNSKQPYALVLSGALNRRFR